MGLVCSDQGKHFEGIKNDLLQHWIDLRGLLKEVESKHPQIEWQWIPPFSPRFTGGVEQYVFLAKKTLKKLVAPQNKTLTDEEFLTVVAKTQGYLNMRPLTIPSQDFKDKTTLTPSDFIGSGSRFLKIRCVYHNLDVRSFTGGRGNISKKRLPEPMKSLGVSVVLSLKSCDGIVKGRMFKYPWVLATTVKNSSSVRVLFCGATNFFNVFLAKNTYCSTPPVKRGEKGGIHCHSIWGCLDSTSFSRPLKSIQ